MLAGLLLAGTVQAQEASTAQPPGLSPAQDAAPAAQGNVTTLGEVRAIKPDEEPLDLYRFRNPVKIEDNRFSRDWREPPSPEQVSMSGGYVMAAIYYGVGKAAQGFNKLTNAPKDIQHAIARPPPAFSVDQQRRALQFCQQQDGCGASSGN
ncbi:hypothetical protein [Stenotrophomonas sp. 24(2023)]|uniref:hypothetical protein n=1 Tax=Stenotrophomonas sp. 24(2023) TaxID=3068324 RepID=UPI0027E0C501|nr:hypothetical protein [Stenotrophomonas sp. 24(2023)]WMJ71172.1 hypothetical protein Q9R17_08785 [Stenotrophomonas sp. 24(2023)]